MSNIDWDFISEREGLRLTGYVPDPDGSKSGVTIATGFDLGARNEGDLEGLPKALIEKLKPYLGIKGAEAQSVAKNLKVTSNQAAKIDEFSKKKATDALKSKWMAATGESFDSLPKNKATVIASVAFQFGDLESETPNFWRQVTNNDWNAALNNLRDFGDKYPTRRNLEADYLEAGMSEEELAAKKKFEDELARDVQYGVQEAMISGEEGGLGSAPTGPVSPSDMSNEQLVKFVQEQISDSRLVDRLIKEIQPQEPIARDDSPVEGIITERQDQTVALDNSSIDGLLSQRVEPDPLELVEPVPIGAQRLEKVTVESDDGMSIKSVTRAGDKAPEPWSMPAYVPNESLADRAKRLMEQDIQDAGPVSQTISKNQLQGSQMFMFAESDSEIWRAAFANINPVQGLADVINDQLSGVNDDPDYDFAADPRLVGRPGIWWRFYDSMSYEETTRRLERLEEITYNQQVLDSSPSMGKQMAAALATPSTLLPIAPLRAMKNTNSIARFATGAAYSSVPIAAEQTILGMANETRTLGDAAIAVAAASVFSGTVNAVFGQRLARGINTRNAIREEKMIHKYSDDSDVYGGPGSLGAALNPDSPLAQAPSFRQAQLQQDAVRETGVGAEKLPFNPVLRMLQSNNPLVRGLAAQMVDMGGVVQKKIDDEIAMDQSVETVFRTTYLFPLLKAIRESDAEYLAYRGIVAKEGDIARSMQMIGVMVKDKFNRSLDAITEYEFRVRVAKAMRRNDVDDVGDAASPYVTKAAAGNRKVLNLIARNAEDVKLFESQILKAIAKAKNAENIDPAKIAELEATLLRVRKHGIFLNTAATYVPRIYRVDKIMANPEGFKLIIRNYGRETLGLRGDALNDYVDNIFDSVTRQKPFVAIEELGDDIEDAFAPGAARMRQFEIEDALIEEFLENDIEQIMRHHVRTMGIDIELQRLFGSFDMKQVLREVQEEWEQMISKVKDPAKKAKMEKQMMADLRDIRGLRDRLRGTYGASKDPHAVSSRFVRAMKSFGVIVGMGGATVSSLPDVIRIGMVEGMNRAYGRGLRTAFRDNARVLKTLRNRELRQAGVAADAILGLRAHAMSDVGDMFGNRMGFERMLNHSTSVMFLLNGLNYWTQFMKEWAGTVTALRMTEAIMKPWERLSRADKEKLLKNGIDESMHGRMQSLIREHGEQIEGEWLPNTDLWGDAAQVERLAFRAALNQNVERIIVTPGAGDRALWTSRELGSLFTQFKSYGQAANMRILISGLQERDAAFYQGALLMVGAASIVNEIKRIQYGIDKPQSFEEKLIDAVERSGIAGSFMDINNAIEKLSNYGVGVRPALLEDGPKYAPMGAKVGAVFGPVGSNMMNVGRIAKDLYYGKADQGTLDTLRFITPLGNHPLVDPLYDRMFNQVN